MGFLWKRDRIDTCDKALLASLVPPHSIHPRIPLKPFCFEGIRKREGRRRAEQDSEQRARVGILAPAVPGHRYPELVCTNLQPSTTSTGSIH